MILDIFTLVLSTIAIVISIIVSVIQHLREKKINSTNLESIYLNDIYKEYLIKQIPTARKIININPSGEISGTNVLIDVLQNLMSDSVYYLYNDEGFYKILIPQCQKLEDYLTLKSDKKILGEEQLEFYNTIQTDLKKIYEIINNRYIGKK